MKKRGGIVSAVAFALCMAILVGVTALLIATPRESEPATVCQLPPDDVDSAVVVKKPRKVVEKKEKRRPRSRSFLDEPVKRK